MITLVTGLWDIKRGELDGDWNRSYEHYLDKFSDLLKTNYNLIIFGDENLKSFVFNVRSSENTQFIVRDVEWFKNNEYYELIQNIRTNIDWSSQVGWLKDSTQARLEMYNPIVMSKMFLLNDARILDKFNSTELYWVDGGISNTVNIDYINNSIDKINTLTNKFLFICFPYETNSEIHGFKYGEMCELTNNKPNIVARGGFFGGPAHKIEEVNIIYYELLLRTLRGGFMGTEESIFTLMVYMYPNLIDYSEIESNGLIYKFFENIINNSVKILNKLYVNTYNLGNNIGLYVITYNSPKQFEVLIESMLAYDKNFITKTKKYLLDNSTDGTTYERYSELCKRYNFEHIKKDNLGITGGRQFIAEHFNTNDELDYYYFFEDDMAFNKNFNAICKNGFSCYTSNLFNKTLDILIKEDFDFLKLNFSEFYGSNDKQWSWYNVPKEFRDYYWPNSSEAPNLVYKSINSYQNLPYAKGEIYLCNWPILMNKRGNYKCYIKTKFKFPYEQTIMSHIFQETIKGNINAGILLLSPTEHNRFDFYDASLRKEC